MIILEDDFLVPGAWFWVALLLGLLLTALWIWSLIDALRFSDRVWVEAGQSRILWVIVIVLLGLFGTLLYLLMARTSLGRARTRWK